MQCHLPLTYWRIFCCLKNIKLVWTVWNNILNVTNFNYIYIASYLSSKIFELVDRSINNCFFVYLFVAIDLCSIRQLLLTWLTSFLILWDTTFCCTIQTSLMTVCVCLVQKKAVKPWSSLNISLPIALSKLFVYFCKNLYSACIERPLSDYYNLCLSSWQDLANTRATNCLTKRA